MAFPWTEVATIATAAGAGAAWLAASASRQAVARANRPFVWPEWQSDYDSTTDRETWRVRLYNDGPGVALDVRWSATGASPPEEMPPDYDYDEELRRGASQPIRGLRPGQAYPANDWLTGTSDAGVVNWLVVRYTDSAGARWEYHEPFDPDDLSEPARRLRKVRSHRSSLSWRWWRLRQRPVRESLLRERAKW